MKETVDLGGGYTLFQPQGVYPCGTDAVLLSAFAAEHGEGVRFADLCSGSGVVPILVCKRRSDVSFSAVEISQAACDAAEKNTASNGLSDRVSVFCGDICKVDNSFEAGSFNCVTVNPPYMKAASGRLPEDEATRNSVAEVLCTAEDVISAASYLLKDGGSLFMVHRTERFDELVALMANRGLTVKLVRFVHGEKGAASKICLIQAVKGSVGIAELSPLILYENGKYTPEAAQIYGE